MTVERTHSAQIRQYLQIDATGVDCGTVEIKEVNHASNRVVIKNKDMVSTWIVIFYHNLHAFAFVRTNNLPRVNTVRTFTHHRILKECLFYTESLSLALQKLVKITPKHYLKYSKDDIQDEN